MTDRSPHDLSVWPTEVSRPPEAELPEPPPPMADRPGEWPTSRTAAPGASASGPLSAQRPVIAPPVGVQQPPAAPPYAPPLDPLLDSSRVSSTGGPEPLDGGSQRSWRLRHVFLAGLAGAVLGAGALGAGYALGVADGEDRLVEAVTPSTSPPQQAIAPPAVPNGEAAVEPVAASAAAIAPSVVQIETNFGIGSGVLYDEADGLIVTNAHVVGNSERVRVRSALGSVLEGDVLGAHAPTDIALVRIGGGSGIPAAELALDAALSVGQLAVAVGSPFGLDQSVTSGIVSATNRVLPTEGGGFVGVIQTDAAINSGNSGGALADRQGRVIGINTAIRTNTGDNAGIGFAVPVETAFSVASQLLDGGVVQLGYLGVELSEIDGRGGVLLTEVVDGSPAAGTLMTGDVVVEIDGIEVSGSAELATAVKGRAPGTEVEIVVERDGERARVAVELGGLDA